MTDEQEESLVPIILQEVPDNCDTCGANMSYLNPIRQNRKTSFGMDWMVVGYVCENCETQHLYR